MSTPRPGSTPAVPAGWLTVVALSLCAWSARAQVVLSNETAQITVEGFATLPLATPIGPTALAMMTRASTAEISWR